MAEQHLTKSELAIMEVMWEQEEALTATEIIKASGDKEWKNSSVHLLVNALLEKKFIEVVGFKKTTKNYARTFKPTSDKRTVS
ncbi:MAG: BlaI/MecI/CopY family transcriptional regulator [Anaerobutyricum sp.]